MDLGGIIVIILVWVVVILGTSKGLKSDDPIIKGYADDVMGAFYLGIVIFILLGIGGLIFG